jgi:hypothetical protein
MSTVPPAEVLDPRNLIRTDAFSLDRLLTHIDPGPAEESEAFVRRIYEQRRVVSTSELNGQVRR